MGFLLFDRLKLQLGGWLENKISRVENLILKARNLKLMANLQHCGEGVRLNERVTIVAPENIKIDDNVHIGNNAYLDGRGGIVIGENTHISRNFVVHSSSHNYQGFRLPYDDTYILKPITIERNVWIGTNVVIVPGIKIGEGAIVGAGTVVSKSVPPLAIVGNQPVRIIKYRDKSHYENLDKQKSYGGVSGRQLV